VCRIHDALTGVQAVDQRTRRSAHESTQETYGREIRQLAHGCPVVPLDSRDAGQHAQTSPGGASPECTVGERISPPPFDALDVRLEKRPARSGNLQDELGGRQIDDEAVHFVAAGFDDPSRITRVDQRSELVERSGWLLCRGCDRQGQQESHTSEARERRLHERSLRGGPAEVLMES